MFSKIGLNIGQLSNLSLLALFFWTKGLNLQLDIRKCTRKLYFHWFLAGLECKGGSCKKQAPIQALAKCSIEIIVETCLNWQFLTCEHRSLPTFFSIKDHLSWTAQISYNFIFWSLNFNASLINYESLICLTWSSQVKVKMYRLLIGTHLISSQTVLDRAITWT